MNPKVGCFWLCQVLKWLQVHHNLRSMNFLEDLVFPTVARPHDDWGPLLETRVLHLEDEAVQFIPDEASILGELLVVASLDSAVALHLRPFVLLAVRDVEDQPGLQEKTTGFVESPQLAIRALSFVQDDVKAIWVEVDDQPLGRLYVVRWSGVVHHNVSLSMGRGDKYALQHL